MQVKAVRCCQAYSGDPEHHDKASHPAARHDCLDGDAARDLRIACADRAARRRASQGRRPSGRQEGRATEGCPAAGCRTSASGGPSATTPGSCATTTSGSAAAASGSCSATASGSAAATACCSSAAAPDAASAPAGGCASPASDATSAAPGCRAKGANSASAAPGGCPFAPDTAASAAAGSSACRAEAACRTDATAAAAFISEGDAITVTCTSAAATGRRQAAARSCHHAGSNSSADCRPSTGRKHDGATAASRRTNDASECWRPDYLPNPASERRRSDCRPNPASGTTRCTAYGYAGRSGCADSNPCADNQPGAGRRRRSDGSGSLGSHRTNRRAGRAKRHATGRPGTERPADRRAGFPPGASGHRAAAGGSATGSRAQSHCPRCATDRTATP